MELQRIRLRSYLVRPVSDDFTSHFRILQQRPYGAIANWCVSGVTDMSQLFYRLYNFNADISGWDTSRVTDMHRMFLVRCLPAPLPCTLRAHRARPRRVPPPAARSPPRAPCVLLVTLGRMRTSSTSR